MHASTTHRPYALATDSTDPAAVAVSTLRTDVKADPFHALSREDVRRAVSVALGCETIATAYAPR